MYFWGHFETSYLNFFHHHESIPSLTNCRDLKMPPQIKISPQLRFCAGPRPHEYTDTYA